MTFVGQAEPTSPVNLFTSLGVSGLVAFVMFLWNRDLAKQRDEAQQTLKAVQPVLAEVQHLIAQSMDVHREGIKASVSAAEALKNMPPPKTWYDLQAIMERVEATQQRAGGTK